MNRAVRRSIGKRTKHHTRLQTIQQVIELSEKGLSAYSISAKLGMPQTAAREVLAVAAEVAAENQEGGGRVLVKCGVPQ